MVTTVRLSEELEQRLDALAERTHRSKSFYLREAIERALPQLEYEHLLVQRAADVRGGRVQTIPVEELVNDVGVEG